MKKTGKAAGVLFGVLGWMLIVFGGAAAAGGIGTLSGSHANADTLKLTCGAVLLILAGLAVLLRKKVFTRQRSAARAVLIAGCCLTLLLGIDAQGVMERAAAKKDADAARENAVSHADVTAAETAAPSLPLPENGGCLIENGNETSVSVTAPDGGESFLIRFYDREGNTAGQTFIRAGESARVRLLGGEYTVKVARGDAWYGETELFGADGSYQQLRNGADETFVFEKDYFYNLILSGSTAGNVGSVDIGGAGNM